MGGEAEMQVFHESNMRKVDADGTQQIKWAVMDDGDTICESVSNESSTISSTSLASSDLMEDATSSGSCSSLSDSTSLSNSGPLYELSELMNHLPIKRGLSRCYQGKSQSFTSLASAESLEDLAKNVNCHSKRLKYCNKKLYRPKATIQKKGTPSLRGYLPSMLGSFAGNKGGCRIRNFLM